MSMAQFGTNVGWALLVTNLPRYLDERFQVPLADRATMQFVPLLVGIAGMLAGACSRTGWCRFSACAGDGRV